VRCSWHATHFPGPPLRLPRGELKIVLSAKAGNRSAVSTLYVRRL